MLIGSKLKFLNLALLPILCVGASCKKDDNLNPVPDAATVTAIINPMTLAPGGEFTVTLALTNFTLDPAGYNRENEAGKGHYAVYVDQQSENYLLGDSTDNPGTFTLPTDLEAGSHQIIVALRNNDRTPLEPAVTDSKPITVENLGPPELSAMVDNAMIPAGGEFSVSVDVTNFQLDPQNYGGTNRPGYGHYHVYLDQIGEDYRIAGSAQPTYRTIMPIETMPGPHQLIVTLQNNDHTPLSPPVEYRIDVTVLMPPPPEMTVMLDVDTVEAGQQVVATVGVSYFELDPENYDGDNIPGHGHYHVYLDQIGEQYLLAATAETPYAVTIPEDTVDGLHDLIFTLNNNDHSPVMPAVEVTIPITVRVLQPPPPDGVIVEGQVYKLGAYLAGNNDYNGNASVLAFGVDPLQTTLSDQDPNNLGAYSLTLPANGQTILFVNKAGYNPTYTTVSTQDQNIVGQRIYSAENAWVNAIAQYHNIDLTAPFDCQTAGLQGSRCVYSIVVGKLYDDGSTGQTLPVAGITSDDFTVTGGQNNGEWYVRGPYFLNYDGTPDDQGGGNTSIIYQDQATGNYRGGLYVTFVEIPQLDGPESQPISMSIAYNDVNAGVTRYFGPVTIQAFRPYGVTWTNIYETGVPVDIPLENIDFDNQVYPLFAPVDQGGLGCQGCHTNQGGAVPAGGMNLYTADAAYASLDYNNYPNRVNVNDPAASLLLTKPLYEVGQQNHPIFAFASEYDVGYQIILKWIEEGGQRNVVLPPVTFDEVHRILYPVQGYEQQHAGCSNGGCHSDQAATAGSRFYLNGDPQNVYDQLVNIVAYTYDPNYDPQLDPNGDLAYTAEQYHINKDNYPERSLVIQKPLAGNAVVHGGGKPFFGAADQRVVLIQRWIAEGYVGPQ